MFYRTYVPRPPLSDFVRFFWLTEGFVLPHGFERVMPSGGMSVVINLFEPYTHVYNRKNLKEYERMDAALDCGYFDQAHFIHDFSAFSGLTPTAYLKLRTQPGNHVPIPD